MLEVRNQPSIVVEVGAVFEVVVSSPVAVPFELRLSWPESPVVEGNAIRFCGKRVEYPPVDVDGGEMTHRYRMEAVAPGQARVVLSPMAAGGEVPCHPRCLEVVVGTAAS